MIQHIAQSPYWCEALLSCTPMSAVLLDVSFKVGISLVFSHHPIHAVYFRYLLTPES